MNKKLQVNQKKIISLCMFLLSLVPVKGNVVFPDLSGWKLKEDQRVYTGKDLWELIDGAADIFLSYDFKDLRIAEYSHKDQIIRAELYRQSTPDNAFGIYTAERMPDYPQVSVGSQGYKSQGVLNFLAGNYYVKIMSAGAEEADENAIAQLAGKINEMLAQTVGLPDVLNLFPAEGKEDLSDAYIAQNFLGYSFLHSAFTMRYKTEAEFQLFIIKDTPEELQHMLDEYLKMLRDEKPRVKDNLMIVKDPYNGTLFMEKKGNYLVGAINTEKEAIATDYIDKVIRKIQ
jgi:hypothetical protein